MKRKHLAVRNEADLTVSVRAIGHSSDVTQTLQDLAVRMSEGIVNAAGNDRILRRQRF